MSLIPIPKGKLVLEYEGKVTEEPEGSDTYVFEICHNRQKQWYMSIMHSCYWASKCYDLIIWIVNVDTPKLFIWYKCKKHNFFYAKFDHFKN